MILFCSKTVCLFFTFLPPYFLLSFLPFSCRSYFSTSIHLLLCFPPFFPSTSLLLPFPDPPSLPLPSISTSLLYYLNGKYKFSIPVSFICPPRAFLPLLLQNLSLFLSSPLTSSSFPSNIFPPLPSLVKNSDSLYSRHSTSFSFTV